MGVQLETLDGRLTALKSATLAQCPMKRSQKDEKRLRSEERVIFEERATEWHERATEFKR